MSSLNGWRLIMCELLADVVRWESIGGPSIRSLVDEASPLALVTL